jgi:hypothetical protein
MTMAIDSTETIVTQSIDSKPEPTVEEPDDESPTNSDSDGHSTEPDSPVENDRDDRVNEIPDGDSNADLHALLAYSKNRLAAQEAAPVMNDEPNEITDDDDIIEDSRDGAADGDAATDQDDTLIKQSDSEEEQLAIARAKMAEAEAKAAADDDYMEALREEARREQALAEANTDNIANDAENDPAHLLKLAEMKVKQAEEKARKDLEATGVNVIKPAVVTTKRSEANSELWALLNYSKVRLETGATPQLGKKRDSIRGDDISVSSKGTKISVSSKTSKKSIASQSVASGSKAPVSVVGSLDNSVKNEAEAIRKNEGEDVPFPDVTGEDASVEGSVSEDDELSDEDGSDSDESEEEEEEEEEELPSFLQDNNEEEAMDPEEVKRLYEEAKFKAASILSVDENLTEVQMLQAMAIAVEAANKGEEKFSTKRSLFKLNEAKIEDLKSFLDFSGMKAKATEPIITAQSNEEEQVRWGIGRGRLIKKLGAAFQDLKERCDEIDERKQKERQGQLTHTELFNAAFDDLKKQIDEYEKIVKSKK